MFVIVLYICSMDLKMSDIVVQARQKNQKILINLKDENDTLMSYNDNLVCAINDGRFEVLNITLT